MIAGGLLSGLPVALSIAERKLGFSIGEHTIYPFVSVIPAIIGAIGPDVDMPRSKSGRKVRVFLKTSMTISGTAVLLLAVYAILGEYGERVFDILLPCLIFFASACCISMFVAASKHRRETHSALVMFILLLPNIYIIRFTEATLFTSALLSAWLGFCIGWLSHLLADSFNKKGVPWFYPFRKKYYRISSIVTGTEGEKVFRVFCVILFVTVYAVLIVSRYTLHT